MTDYAAIAAATLPLYGFPPDASATLINVSENATFRIDAGGVPLCALRIHREGYHSKAAIASELAWIEALRAGNTVITPAPLKGRDGALIQTAGGRQIVAFAWEAGSEPKAESLAPDFVRLGRVAAAMHAQAKRWARPAGFARLTWDYDGAFGPSAHWGQWRDGLGLTPELEKLFGRALECVARRLAAFSKGHDRFGLVHCDMRLANLLVEGDRTKVIDFDDCGFSWFLYDCATAVSFFEHDPAVPDLIAAWVKGYREVAPLSAAEEAELPTFIMFRRLLLIAWIGSHAETDLARSQGAAYTEQTGPLCEAYLKKFSG